MEFLGIIGAVVLVAVVTVVILLCIKLPKTKKIQNKRKEKASMRWTSTFAPYDSEDSDILDLLKSFEEEVTKKVDEAKYATGQNNMAFGTDNKATSSLTMGSKDDDDTEAQETAIDILLKEHSNEEVDAEDDDTSYLFRQTAKPVRSLPKDAKKGDFIYVTTNGTYWVYTDDGWTQVAFDRKYNYDLLEWL